MKKRSLILSILLLALCNLFMVEANADTVNIRKEGEENLKTLVPVYKTGYNYKMLLYKANINGKDYMTYCLDAGRSFGGASDQYTVTHVVDPYQSQNDSVWYKFDVAATYAYQYMVQNGFATTTKDNNIIGEIVFRWLTERYIPSSQKCTQTGPGLKSACNVFRSFENGLDPSDWRVVKAIEIYNLAIQLAEKNLPYDELIANGYSNSGQGLWGVKWETKTYTNSPINSEQNQLYIEMKPANGVSLDKIDFNQFSVYFTNESVKNNIVSQSAAKVSNDTVSITVTFNKGTWDGQDVGAVVRAYFCDSMDAASQLALVEKKGSQNKQRMLVVLPGEGSCPDSPHSGSRDYPIRNSNCSCDTNTGEYVYRRYKDGSLMEEVRWFENDANSEANKKKYNCPDTCTKKTNPHTCETPEESGDGNYYCKESEPGKGDGKKCSEKEYEVQCLGKINCAPTITMPSDCNDFDIEGVEKGSISDINKVQSSCNPNVNEIKQCVIDNNDLTGESFEATKEMNNNPYCKVWCEESFDFTLPTAKLSDSGGYFTINTTVTGERSCYVSGAKNPKEGIDNKKFQEDLATKQKEVIDAWNEYNKWKVAASTSATEKEDSCTHEAHTDECDCSIDEFGKETCNTCSCDGCSATGKLVTKDWEYTAYYYDGTSHKVKESYSDGELPDCQHGSCTGKIGKNPDSDHRANRDNAKQALIDKLNELNNIIVQYNSCSGVVSNGTISDLISSAANSTGWDNDFDFDPAITYNYNQDYINQMNGKMSAVGSGDEKRSETYCSGETDDQYNCLSGNSSSVKTEKLTYFRCNESGCYWDSTSIDVSLAKWVKKTKTRKQTYAPNNTFSTYTQYGTIKFGENNSHYLYSKLPSNALPISLITETGVFPFVITYTNIGQSNATGEANGRLIGKETSVITEYAKLDDSLKCSDTDTMDQKIGYVCHYLNNCKGDCDFTCDDDNNCEFEGCANGDCTLTCENCIFDGNNSTYSYRTVSLNKLFPNDRTGNAGYNWNGTIKGEITQREIESASDTIYEEPEYSFTLTPNNLKNIRDYNDKVGSYTNSKTIDNEDAMRCYNQSVNGKEYPVKCTSTFLDMVEGVENENFSFSKYKNKYAQSDSVIRPDYESRFILADQMVDSNGNLVCQNFNCVSRDSYIGPAWK